MLELGVSRRVVLIMAALGSASGQTRKGSHQQFFFACLLVFAVLRLMLPFSVFPLCARTHLVRDLSLMLHRQSGTVFLAKLDHQTHSHTLNHL